MPKQQHIGDKSLPNIMQYNTKKNGQRPIGFSCSKNNHLCPCDGLYFTCLRFQNRKTLNYELYFKTSKQTAVTGSLSTTLLMKTFLSPVYSEVSFHHYFFWNIISYDGVVITVKRSPATAKQCQSHWQILPWISFSFRFASFPFYWDAACVVHIINEPILGYSQSKCEQVQPWRTHCTFSLSSQTSAWLYKRSRPCLTGKGQCCQETAEVRGYGPSDGS